MKPETYEIKTKGAVVGSVDVSVWETLDEVLENVEPDVILSLVNRQSKTDACNKERASHREKTAGKGKRYEAAINVLYSLEFADGSTGIDRLNECIALGPNGAKKAMDELLNSTEVQAAVDEVLEAAVE